MNFNKIKSNIILRSVILLSILLIILMYFLYRPLSWPFGYETAGCLISLGMLTATVYLLWRLRAKFINYIQNKNVAIGLCFGFLWTADMIVNYLFHPDLPLRNNIDNIFFSLIAVLIFMNAVWTTYRTNNFTDGVRSGFWSGISSGAIACFTVLTLIIFGMPNILLDPLKIKEWTEIQTSGNNSGMAVYFAYQTFSRAIMHLFILGALMGLFLGFIAGLSGKILILIKNLNSR